MKLIDSQANISDIALDPFNPRNLSFKSMSQQQILDATLDRKETKELLHSMEDCIRWVNKIVVIHYDDFKSIHKEEMREIANFKYVAIEGNTRLACLKSGYLSSFSPESKIPILIAQKEDSDTISTFAESILITQGIANVMVVKEWSVVSKAKHIYDMYRLKVNNSSKSKKETLKDAIKSISEELGIAQEQIRNAIKRYTIYAKIGETVERIPEDKWGFLEAFDINQDTRNFIGLSEEYEWDDEKAEEVLRIIPDLIKYTASRGVLMKSFRDQFRQFVAENKDQERTDVLEKLRQIDENTALADLLKTQVQKDGKDDWVKKIDNILKQLKQYPIAEGWTEQIPQLQNVSRCLNQIISTIKSFE